MNNNQITIGLAIAILLSIVSIGLSFKPIHVTVESTGAPAYGGVGDYTNYSKLSIDDTTGNTLVVDTNTLVVDATNNRVGLSTTTPGATLSFGKSSTSTIYSTSPLCFAAPTDGSGTNVLYYWMSTSSQASARTGWATSTTACFSSL